MARRLTAAGMRPINNVVDVSNYVMLELNQPNHAYDLDTLGGGGFRVRTAHDGEPLTTLDGQHAHVHRGRPADLRRQRRADRPRRDHGRPRHRDQRRDHDDRARDGLVRDGRDRPGGDPQRTAFGGVGPLRARCRPVRDAHRHRPVRRTAERDVPEPRRARRRRRRAHRPTAAGRSRRSTCASPRSTACSAPTSPPTTSRRCSTRSATRCAGTGDVRTVALPSWRLDSTAEIDVVEEVARHYGYDRLGKTVPKSVVHGGLSVRQQRRRLAREVLLGLGISEAMPNPFLAPDTLRARRSPARGADRDQPARGRRERAAHLAATRAAPGDRLQRIAPPHRCAACSRSATCTRRARPSCRPSTRR